MDTSYATVRGDCVRLEGLRCGRRSRGQSLVVAIVVMFVLLFLGAIFVGMVARNLLNTGRARDTQKATQLANAGIHYAGHFLQHSPEGADWRPEPPAREPDPSDPDYVRMLRLFQADPDRLWLRDGYSRVMLPGGRALIRVDHVPDPANPLGRFIRVSAVGRTGELDVDDPTTFVDPITGFAPRLRRELVGYKTVGLTDFGRFVTNFHRESKFEAAIGVPPIGVPVQMQLGDLPVRAPGATGPLLRVGYPIHVNGPLRLLDNVVLALNPALHERVTAAGPVIVDNANQAAAGRPRLERVDQPGEHMIFGSTEIAGGNPAFSTFGGVLVDNAGVPDAEGWGRSAVRINPPAIDAVADPATGVTRYRAGTRDSGVWLTRSNGSSFNTGRYGLGQGIYVDNFNNTERETLNVAGGQSLRSIWLQPGPHTPFWNGPHFVPPGVYIEFGYPVMQERGQDGAALPGRFVARPGFRMVRDANDRPFRDPSGAVALREQVFGFFIYKPAGQKPVLKLDNEPFRRFLTREHGLSDADVDRFLPPFNGVVFAEGNVRVRGLLPSRQNIPIRVQSGDPDAMSPADIRASVNPPAMNIVSAGNIYIEGSLVREQPESMIGLLAQNYVVVNTTMFLSPNKAMPYASTNQDEAPPFHTNVALDEPSRTPPFTLDFLQGDDASVYGQQYLLLRHGTAPGLTYLNLLINEALPPVGRHPLYAFNNNAQPFSALNPPPTVYALTNAIQGSDLFENAVFPLYPTPPSPSSPFDQVQYQWFTAAGARNTLRPQVDLSFTGGMGVQDYLFSRAAVVPKDVRIEAVIYAQTGSFFVVPGYPMNTNPADTRDAAVRRAAALGFPSGTLIRPPGTNPMFPFFNEPVACRITIVGAISENRTASIADQAAWMQLWGYIPDRHGSSTIEVPRAHAFVDEVGGNGPDQRTSAERDWFASVGHGVGGITRGLRFLFDPALLAPFPSYTFTPQPLPAPPGRWAHSAAGTFRQDEFGRYLPPIPRLPVSPGFIYIGEERLTGL